MRLYVKPDNRSNRAAVSEADSAHWLLEPSGTTRRSLTPAIVVEAAHELLHNLGREGLSMRALADALETSTTHLYRQVPSKDWLLVAVVDYVLGKVDVAPAYEPTSWRQQLWDLSMAVRKVLVAHPHVHPILTDHVVLTPNMMRIAEAALHSLAESPVPEAELIEAYNAWSCYVIGFTSIEIKPSSVDIDRDLQRALRSHLRDATDDEFFPTISGLETAVVNRAYGLRWTPKRLGPTGQSFEWGLDALLRGIEEKAREAAGHRQRASLRAR
jgi:AcrR family transcriptional regulator